MKCDLQQFRTKSNAINDMWTICLYLSGGIDDIIIFYDTIKTHFIPCFAGSISFTLSDLSEWYQLHYAIKETIKIAISMLFKLINKIVHNNYNICINNNCSMSSLLMISNGNWIIQHAHFNGLYENMIHLLK